MKRPEVFVTVYLSDAGVDALVKPLAGGGGFQLLLERCRKSFRRERRAIEVTLEDWARLQRYRASHGRGGYQSRLKAMLP